VNADDLAVPDADPLAAGEVLVSAGGGAVGHDFVRRVADAMPWLPLADRTWRFVTGHHMRADAAGYLRGLRRPNLVVETMRPDLPALMAAAALSISQAGYNTLLELLAVRARAVVVPFEGGVETEQRLRAELLAQAGALEVVAEPELGPATLAAAIGRALARPRDAVPAVDLAGARATGAIVAQMLRERVAA
jgi:predicted glycosyltransferase